MKISQKAYSDFCINYFSELKKKGLRFGQAFINTFFLDNMTDDKLFYMTDNAEAIRYIFEYYIEKGEIDK